MKKSILVSVVFALGFASGLVQAQEKNVFSCIDKATLSVDESCLSKTIELEQKLNQFTSELKEFKVPQTEYAMATIAFYPELNLIRVIADSPEENKKVEQIAVNY